MPDDLHDRFGINPSISQICDRTMPEIVEDEIFDLLALADLPHRPVGVGELLPVLPEYSP
jgi:hypothetical protein